MRELRGMLEDPLAITRKIARNRTAILKLLDTMPDADQTPGLFLQPMGKNIFRLSAPGGDALELKFRHVDMIIEDNQFKLVQVS